MHARRLLPVLLFALIALLLLTAWGPAPAAAADVPGCGCGEYVGLYNFGKYVNYTSGNWGSAYRMASPLYWRDGLKQYPERGVWRYRTTVPQAGDVVFIQPNAKYILLDPSFAPVWEDKGVPDGHAGFVERAVYYNQRTLLNTTYSGWEISLRSANWMAYEKYAAVKTFTDQATGCSDVNVVNIFVPNGDSISFWHKAAAPTFARVSAFNGLALSEGGTTPGSKVAQNTPSTSAFSQVWAFEKTGEKYMTNDVYRVISLESGMCLDVSGVSTQDSAPVIVYTCNNANNQKWALVNTYSGFQLQAVHSGKVLDVPGATLELGKQMIQYQANNGSNQVWKINWISDYKQLP